MLGVALSDITTAVHATVIALRMIRIEAHETFRSWEEIQDAMAEQDHAGEVPLLDLDWDDL